MMALMERFLANIEPVEDPCHINSDFLIGQFGNPSPTLSIALLLALLQAIPSRRGRFSAPHHLVGAEVEGWRTLGSGFRERRGTSVCPSLLVGSSGSRGKSAISKLKVHRPYDIWVQAL
ncbi:uncharacterized protein FPOAC1_013436 [Fusarium poae]|uniref:uncharacterized protein n=1 Tax=Fusarium poae TaxID=36050 RepID=UPI001D03F175|nr:uncharacterized protein FPOAC1_013436 [Fusarium poae]KAG8664656.1 hypothetical protein FPOAC1_013436 [Fusarium poae]